MTRPRARRRPHRLPARAGFRPRGLPGPATFSALIAQFALAVPAAAANLPRWLQPGLPPAWYDEGEIVLLAALALVAFGLLAARRGVHRARTRGEARFRHLLEAAPFGIVVVRDEHAVFLNDTARQALGLPADARPDSAALAQLLPGLAAPSPAPAAGPARAAERREVRLRLPDGQTHDLRLVSLTTTFDAAPARLYFFTDATAELASQRELERSRERLALALEAARDGVWDADLQTGRVAHNPAFGTVIDPGAPAPDDLRSWRDLVHPADRPRLEQAIAAHERGAVAGYECELRIRRRDGSVAWVLEHGRVVERDAAGRVRRLAGTVREITARKRAEQRLEVRNRLAAVFPGARDEELRAALGGVVREALESTTALIGLLDAAGNLHLTRLGGEAGRPVAGHAVLTPPQRPAGLRRLLEAPGPLFLRSANDDGGDAGAAGAAAAEAGLPWPDSALLGAPLPGGGQALGLVAVGGRPGRYATEDERTLTGLAADLAPLIRAHLETEAKEAQLAQAQKMEALGVLAGGIAHDFNNILQAILGFSALARQDTAEPERLLADLDRVQRATERGRDLVQRILQFSRVGEPEAPPLDPLPLVEQLVREARAGAPPRVTVVSDLAADCGRVRAEPAQLRQVLVNLVTNARQALEAEGGTLTVAVAPATVAADDARLPADWHGRAVVVFTVADTGPGIPEAHHARLFDPFFTTREVGQGAGLGLSVVHGLVGGLGGRVTIECPPAGGTVATVHLPRVDAATAPAAAPETPAVAAAPAVRPRILFVDDDVEIRELALALLGRAGCEVDVAVDGLAACEQLLARPDFYDAIVTDEIMPGLGGRDLAHRVAELRPDLPVILVTGLDGPAAAETAPPGVREVVGKPFRGETLAQAVRRALAIRPAAPGSPLDSGNRTPEDDQRRS
jgi:PAS domain S-box-containing protein